MNTRINDFLSVIEISQDTVDFAIEYSPDIYGYIRLNTQNFMKHTYANMNVGEEMKTMNIG